MGADKFLTDRTRRNTPTYPFKSTQPEQRMQATMYKSTVPFSLCFTSTWFTVAKILQGLFFRVRDEAHMLEESPSTQRGVLQLPFSGK